jgi:hypothetical protein
MPPKKARVRLSSLGETPAATAQVGPAAVAALADAVAVADVADAVAVAQVADAVAVAQVAEVACCEAKNDAERAYLSSLSAIERNVCRIAEDHLQTSFDLSRSSGYIAWSMKKQ